MNNASYYEMPLLLSLPVCFLLAAVLAVAPVSSYAVPLDIDGDGASDLFGFENQRDGSANELAYRIRRSSDGVVTKIEFGKADDAPVPADYDGDGTTDLGYVRLEQDSTLSWNLRLSGQDNAVVTTTFGAALDDVLSGCDFDGDGKADKAVIRGTDALIEKSSDSTTATIAMGVTPDNVACGARDATVGDELIVNHTTTRSMFTVFNLAGETLSDLAFGSKVSKILVVDINGDGVDELAYLQQGGTRVYIHDGTSSITVKTKKSSAIAAGVYAYNTTQEGIISKTDRDDTFSIFISVPSTAFTLKIDDSETILPAVNFQSVGPRQSREAACTIHLDPYDGNEGFLWKPVSNTGNPASHLPRGIRGGKVTVVKNGRVLETLKYSGNGNGGRDLFRSKKRATTFPFGMTLMQKRGSTVRCWLLDDPTVRHD